MITAPALGGLPGIRHGFLTRRGGRSTGVFDSLNIALGNGDDPALVRENRGLALKRAGMAGAALVTPRQVHSPTVIPVTDPWDNAHRPEADGLVTDRPGLALGISTADCAPVLFADAEAGVIGAAHAGWGGALGGILEATMAAMADLGAAPDRTVAAIGPCIGPDSYEVGPEYRARFVDADPANARWFTPLPATGKHLFDLPGYVGARLAALGLKAVAWTGDDTLPAEDRFFSYRRACHRHEARYGCQLSVVSRDG